MKKIALFSLMVCMGVLNAYAANQCKTGITFAVGNNNWNAGSNEYLFETKRDFLNAINSGYFYECDSNDRSNCGNNTYVEVAANHVFQDKTVKEKAIYKCETGAFNDKWVKVSNTSGLTKCDKKRERYSQFQNFSADEYLYPTVTDYDAVKSRVSGQVLECDSNVCKDGTIVKLAPGHVFLRKDINEPRTYKCVLSTGDDKWVDITDDCKDCDDKVKPQPQPTPKPQPTPNDCPDGTTRATKDITVIGVCTGELCTPIVKGYCYDTDFLKCMEAADRGEPANWNGKSCNCGDRMVWDNKNYKCIAKGDNGGGKTTTKKTCKELYAGYPERIACCEAGKDTKWVGSLKDGSCSCVDTSKKWDSAKKQCITPVQVVSDCIYNYDVTIVCDYGTTSKTYHETGSQPLKESQLDGLGCTEFNVRFGTDIKKWQQLFGNLCDDEPSSSTTTTVSEPSVVNPLDTKIKDAQRILEAFKVQAEKDKSVWKTAEGKFNTTRLASDITAGVVLGTVGGVVTGVVIKKNQVKKGFEALHCTVGGQKVAEWGDEFSVGLKR